MVRFITGPTGVGEQAENFLSDENTGTATWSEAFGAAAETGFKYTGLGLAGEEAQTPDTGRALEFPKVTIPTARGNITTYLPRVRLRSEEEVAHRGDILATNQTLWEAQFPTVPYEKGMTVKRGLAIKDSQDRQAIRDHYMKDRPITAFVGQLVGGSASPENFIPIFGEVSAVGAIGRAALTVGKSAAEGAIGTAAFDVATKGIRAARGEDTSWKAITQDIAFGTIIGGIFGGAVHAGTTAFNMPVSNGLSVKDLVNNPQTKAQANVIMNDAIGSFLNSPDNKVYLSPQSFSYLQQNLMNVPQESLNLNWEHLTVSDTGEVQRYTESHLLNDPDIRSMFKGTQVANERGTPQVVYTGSLDPITGRPELEGFGLFDEEHGDQKRGAIWFSSEPAHVFRAVDIPNLVEGKDYDAYHGTRKAFDRFEAERLGSNTGASDTKAGFWGVDSSRTAEEYARINFETHIDDFDLSNEDLAKLSKSDRKKYKSLMKKITKMDEELGAVEGEEITDEVRILQEKFEKAQNQLREVTGPLIAEGMNIRPLKIHLKNPLIVNESREENIVRQRRDFIKEAKAKGHDGVIIKDTSDFGDPKRDVTYIVFRPEQIRSRFESLYPRSPNMMPALVDIKNPLKVRAPDGLTPKDRAALIKEAKEKGYDGIIVTGIKDASGRDATQYATWQPDNIVQVADASARKIQKTIDEKLAYVSNSNNLSERPGYSYKPTPEMPNIAMFETPNKGIDLNALTKEADINKFIPNMAKAEGTNLDTGENPVDPEFDATVAATPMNEETKATYDEALNSVKKANMLEEIMKIATGCI